MGDNPDPSKNFVLSVPAVADGTLSIKRQDGTNVLSIDAAGKAVIPGVVGTVAQVGGVPTGQVVERGSNANGEYVRFADGTQICTAAVTYPQEAFQLTSSPIYQSSRKTWTYPAAFFGPSPSPSANMGNWITNWAAYGGDEGNTLTKSEWRFLTTSAQTPVELRVRYLAIGRWY